MPKIIEHLNEVLLLKGSYQSKDNDSKGGAKNLKKDGNFDTKKLLTLRNQLIHIKNEWANISIISGALVNVQYNCVVPKSSRIDFLLRQRRVKNGHVIVGAKFIKGFHNVTYYLSDRSVIDEAIDALQKAYVFTKNRLGDEVTKDNFNIKSNKIDPVDYHGCPFARSNYRKLIVESSIIDSFDMPRYENKSKDGPRIISFYETDKTGKEICDLLRLSHGETSIITSLDEKGNLLQVDDNTFNILSRSVPFLICNSTSDLLSITPESIVPSGEKIDINLPNVPIDEPTIGVIDSRYDSHVFFSNWVEYNDDFYDGEYEPEDYHGTEIDSILVDGAEINKDRFDDGCGYFRVKHFHVASKKHGIPSNILVEKIKTIVQSNPSIHVWNLSLGSDNEIDSNYISYEAEVLDKLQYENKEIVFVIAGTNLPEDKYSDEYYKKYKIGAPADSINSIVVNSIDTKGEVPLYARKGGVLSFYNKPDFATFGGAVRVCNQMGEGYNQGTSFAAPWISRKMCFLMDKMNLTREAAKALLIDSAAKWSPQGDKQFIGYGVVPTNIETILKTNSDEIRFILNGLTVAYKTYNYNLPVPMNSDFRYPFIARATLCYYPSCDRKQGVDYTETELSIKFGRLKNGTIDDINDNVQDEDGNYTDENNARKYQRKWDNVKFISMDSRRTLRSLKSYDNKMWGISITSKQRNSTEVEKIPFSAVVTLKEIEGKNRFETFVEQCLARGWQVERISIEARNKLYLESQEELILDDDNDIERR